MKQLFVALTFFSLMACGKKDTLAPTLTPKPDTTVVVKKAGLITAQFVDGKKLFDYTYNDSGNIIKINQYNDEVGALDTLMSITNLEYNTKGLVTKISSREPDSAFANYIEDITYDANRNPITDTKQYYSSWERKYKIEDIWIRKNVIYDANGRITLLEAETQNEYDTTKEKQEYKYDADTNLIESNISRFDKIKNKYVINGSTKIQEYYNIPIPVALIVYATYPLNRIKKLYKKVITDNPDEMSTGILSVLENDSKGNPIKIKIDESSISKLDGSVSNSSHIITLTYK